MQQQECTFYKDLPDFSVFKHIKEGRIFIKVCNAQALTMEGKDAIFALKDYCKLIKPMKCISRLYN